MLTLKITAENFEKLHQKILQVGPELFEFGEKGFFDEGSDEWIFRKDNFELEYEEGEMALSSKPESKQELNLGECDCGQPWDHDGICSTHEKPKSVEEKKPKRNGRNRKRRGL